MVNKKWKVLVTGRIHEQAIENLKKFNKVEVYYHPDCSLINLEKLTKDIHVLITRSETSISSSFLDNAKNLRIIARAAVGVGNIDIEAATRKGILVLNTPGRNTNSAAEHTVALLLSMFRNIPQAYQKMKKGGWDRHSFIGYELHRKKVGIIGFGNVGHRVAKFLQSFDMNIFVYDPYVASDIFARCGVVACDSLPNLFTKVDIVSIHVPLCAQTKYMIDAEMFSRMQPGTFLLIQQEEGLYVRSRY